MCEVAIPFLGRNKTNCKVDWFCSHFVFVCVHLWCLGTIVDCARRNESIGFAQIDGKRTTKNWLIYVLWIFLFFRFPFHCLHFSARRWAICWNIKANIDSSSRRLIGIISLTPSMCVIGNVEKSFNSQNAFYIIIIIWHLYCARNVYCSSVSEKSVCLQRHINCLDKINAIIEPILASLTPVSNERFERRPFRMPPDSKVADKTKSNKNCERCRWTSFELAFRLCAPARSYRRK